MKRMLIRSNAFVRAAKHLLKKHPQLAKDLRVALDVMSKDVFDPKLKTHKLKGDLEGSWSCSAGYDLRIIFQFVQHEGSEAVLLQTVGTHDEVY